MPKITAIVLAAGRSRRMGRSKPLLQLAGKSAIRWCLEALGEAGLSEIVVVLGSDGAAIAATIADLPHTLAWNRAEGSDMAGSLRIGLNQANPEAESLLIYPADYPLIAMVTIRGLLAAQKKHPEQIIIPTYLGQKGHPVLFPRPILAELAELPTLRDLVRRDPGRLRLLEVDDEAILLDMDTPEDYQLLQDRLARRHDAAVSEFVTNR